MLNQISNYTYIKPFPGKLTAVDIFLKYPPRFTKPGAFFSAEQLILEMEGTLNLYGLTRVNSG